MMLLELRRALRTLAKTPGFAALSIVTMALGIGAATVLFSVTESVLWRPLPFPESERLVCLIEQNLKRPAERGSVSAPDFRDWREHIQTLESIAAANWGETHNLTGEGIGERVSAKAVSAGFFETLGVRPAIGRTFGREEDQGLTNRSVILSHALWQRAFDGSPEVLGHTLKLDGESCTVVGVMPAGFRLEFVNDPEVFLPLRLSGSDLRRENRALMVIGRMRPGVSMNQVSAEVQSIAAAIAAANPQSNSNWGAGVENLREAFTSSYRRNLFLYLGFSVLVLLIACTNVAGLLLVRTLGRQKEFALRTALGASRACMLRQVLAETFWIAVPGGITGAILASWGVVGVRTILPAGEFIRSDQISMDLRTLLFVLAVTLASTFAFALAPTLTASKLNLDGALRDWGKSVDHNPRTARRLNILISAELTLAFLLLFSAGLFLSTHAQLQHVQLGFDPRSVLTMRIAPGSDPHATTEKTLAFSQALLQHVADIPGVERAALASALPLTGTASIYVTPADRPKPAPGEEPRSLVRVVSADYFRVMSIPLVQGRGFSNGDSALSPRVAIVNENLSHLFFGDDNPVGRQLTILSGGSGTIPLGTVQIVGLARNTREVGVDEVRFNDVYLPFAQAPQRSMYVAAKTTARQDEVASALRRDLRSLDPDGAVYGVLPMEQRISDYLAGARFNLALIGLFAGLAMLLAGVGVYGAIAFSVAQRTREFGVRMALGAGPLSILSLTLNRTARLTLAGAGCGFVLAWILGALLHRAMYLVPGEHGGMLYGVGIHDPVSFGGAAAIMLGLAAIGGLLPAARAAKLDPLAALRHD